MKASDRSRFLSVEASVGITGENFEKKYIFHKLKERFLNSSNLTLESFTPDGHENIYLPLDLLTPSQVDGIPAEDELALRMHGAQMCMQAAFQLKLPITTAITGVVVFHRFFTKNSFVDYDYREICMAALFLAGKVDETCKKTWDIAGAFTTVFNKQSQNPLDIIIKQERLILKELGFELFRSSDHPHKLIETFFNFVKVGKQVAQKAWNYINDSYMTDLCVHFPPQVIAAGALYLAMRVCNHDMPTQPWWVLFEASLEHIEYIAATILSLYEMEKMNFGKARRILEKANRLAYINKHNEFYGTLPDKVEKPVEVKKPEPPKVVKEKTPEKKSIKKKESKDRKSKDKKKEKKNKEKSKDKKKEKKNKKKKSRDRSKDKSKDKKKKDKDNDVKESQRKEKKEQKQDKIPKKEEAEVKKPKEEIAQKEEIEQQMQVVSAQSPQKVEQTNDVEQVAQQCEQMEVEDKPKLSVKQQIANLKSFIKNQQQKLSQKVETGQVDEVKQERIETEVGKQQPEPVEKDEDEDDQLLQLKKRILARKEAQQNEQFDD